MLENLISVLCAVFNLCIEGRNNYSSGISYSDEAIFLSSKPVEMP